MADTGQPHPTTLQPFPMTARAHGLKISLGAGARPEQGAWEQLRNRKSPLAFMQGADQPFEKGALGANQRHLKKYSIRGLIAKPGQERAQAFARTVGAEQRRTRKA